MKVSLSLNNSNVGFKGYMPVRDDKGYRGYEFSYPFDPKEQNCYLEIFSLNQDKYGNYKIDKIIHNKNKQTRVPLNPNGSRFNLAKEYGLPDNIAFAYHFILENKHDHTIKPAIDAGDSIDERPERHSESDSRVYNIVASGQTTNTRGGAMRLVITDTQHVGRIHDKNNRLSYDKALDIRAQNSVKTLVNKFGGTLGGIEYGLINEDYNTDIIALPFTDQSNVYWTKNLFQIDPSMGNINNYGSMQREMFKQGKNYVSDGAFVNEGLEGIHFNHILKYGEESPYFHWFRASGLKDKPFNLGIFSREHKDITHKLINPPILYLQDALGNINKMKNPDYNPKEPTYMQYLDKKFVTIDDINDCKNFIKSYEKLNTDYIYDVNTNNHTIFPYAIEINPECYDRNIDRIDEYNKKNLKNETLFIGNYRATKFLSQGENYGVDEGFESGFETWDANPDIGKLNFGFSNADNKTLMNLRAKERKLEISEIKRGNAQVQDYTVDAGKYWTGKTNDIMRLYVAQNLKNNFSKENSAQAADKLRNMSNNKILPKSLAPKIDNKEVRNVLSGIYNCENRVLSTEDKKSQILEGLMNMPLDSIEFGDNLVAALASPMISKRAGNLGQVGMTRYELFKAGNPHLAEQYKLTYNKMDNLYKNEMSNYAISVLDKVDEQLPPENKLFDGDRVTRFGQYVLPLALPVIAKYEIIKALAPDTDLKIDAQTGEIFYDYEKLKNTYLQTLGITNPGSVEDEALMVLSSLKKGLTNLNSDNEIVESISTMLKGTNANSFALADYVIDKTQAGLDWRIDATKDIADIEALRNYNMDFETTWQNVTDFWKRFSQSVLKENPHSYLVAEITNVDDLHAKGKGGYSTKFPKTSDVVQKFLRETGITSTADYAFYYYNIAKIFSKSFEDGKPLDSNDPNYITAHIYNQMIKSGAPFLKSASLPSIMYSYSFVANHDKPRPLHCAAMDMGLFYADLQSSNCLRGFKEDSYKLIMDKFDPNFVVTDQMLNNFDFEKVSPKAIAMGMALRKGFIDVLNKYKAEGHLTEQEHKKIFESISKSISDLSQGKYLGKYFEPDSFAVKPFEVNIDSVIKNAKVSHNLHMPTEISDRYADDVFEAVVDPAIPKLLAMMKFLVALPGRPTIFDGDDMGSTGWESETKNQTLQCRNKVHEEWVTQGNPKFKEFLKRHKVNFDQVMGLRSNPKLEPLNNGAPFMLPMQDAQNEYNQDVHYNIPAVLRQSTNGKMTISILNTADKNRGYGRYNYDHENKYEPEELVLDSIKLNFQTDRKLQDGNITTYDVPMGGEWGIGIPGLKHDLIFRNANDPNDKYYVNKVNDKYIIKHGSGDGKIYLKDTVMHLYYDPADNEQSNEPVFQGRFNTQTAKFVENAYSQEKVVNGKTLLLNAG